MLSDHIDLVIENLSADYGAQFMLGFRVFEEHRGNSWENEQSKPFWRKHRQNYDGMGVRAGQIYPL